MFKSWVSPILALYFMSAVAGAHSARPSSVPAANAEACNLLSRAEWPLKPLSLISKYNPGTDDLQAIRKLERDNAAQFLTREQQRLIEVQVDNQGRLYYPSTGKVVDTQNRLAVFVLTQDGHLLLMSDALLNEKGPLYLKSLNLPIEPFRDANGDCCLVIYHSVVAGGARNVLMAGTIVVSQGEIIYIANSSGHYKPKPTPFVRFLESFERKGADLSQSIIEIYNLADSGIRSNWVRTQSAFRNYIDREPTDFWSKVDVVRALYGELNFDYELEILPYEQTTVEILKFLAREMDPDIPNANELLQTSTRFVPMQAMSPLQKQMDLLVTLGQIVTKDPESTLIHQLMRYVPKESNKKWLENFSPHLSSITHNDVLDSDDYVTFPIQFLDQRLGHLSSEDWKSLIEQAQNEERRQRLLIYAYRMNAVLPEHIEFFSLGLRSYSLHGTLTKNTLLRVLALNVMDHKLGQEASRTRLQAYTKPQAM